MINIRLYNFGQMDGDGNEGLTKVTENMAKSISFDLMSYVYEVILNRRTDSVFRLVDDNFDGKYILIISYRPDYSHTKIGVVDGILNSLPKKYIDDIKSDKCKLVFDGGQESWCPNDDPIQIEKLIQNKELPFKNILWLDADPVANDRFPNIECLNLYFHAVVSHDHLKHFCDETYIKIIKNGKHFLRPKHYLMTNLVPRIQRLYLTYLCDKNNLIDKGFVSFPDITNGKAPICGPYDQKENLLVDLNEYEGYIDNTNEWLEYFKENKKLPFQFDTIGSLDDTKTKVKLSDGEDLLTHHDTTWGPYFNVVNWLNVYFDVNSESWSNWNNEPSSPVFTEKTWRPILCGSPQLLVCEPGALQTLRDLGFSTFDTFFDNSYDNQPHGRKRTDMIFKEIKRLCSMEKKDLHKLYYNHLDEIIHNIKHFPKFIRSRSKLLEDILEKHCGS